MDDVQRIRPAPADPRERTDLTATPESPSSGAAAAAAATDVGDVDTLASQQPPWRRIVLYAVLLLASLANNLSFILIDYIRPFLVRDVGFTLTQTSLLYSVQAAGVILGSFTTPLLVARVGPRTGLIIAATMLAASTGSALLIQSFVGWAALRLLVGIGLAGMYVSSMTLLANAFAARVRGRLLTFNMSMFSVALLTAGAIGSTIGEQGWRVLVEVTAVAPAVIAVLVLTCLPRNRPAGPPIAGPASPAAPALGHATWREMFRGRRAQLTLSCLVLAGLNFSGYQFYSGFITTYLTRVRQFDASMVGYFVSIDGVGTLAGSLLWGWVADRYGRRAGALGFGVAALFIGLFLIAPRDARILFPLEFGYAVCLSAANSWSAFFAELFPVRLRPMGTSLFHGGHVISLAAPLIVATVAHSYSLGVGMALAPLTFVVAAVLWWRLPETLTTSPFYRGFDRETATEVFARPRPSPQPDGRAG